MHQAVRKPPVHRSLSAVFTHAGSHLREPEVKVFDARVEVLLLVGFFEFLALLCRLVDEELPLFIQSAEARLCNNASRLCSVCSHTLLLRMRQKAPSIPFILMSLNYPIKISNWDFFFCIKLISCNRILSAAQPVK